MICDPGKGEIAQKQTKINPLISSYCYSIEFVIINVKLQINSEIFVKGRNSVDPRFSMPTTRNENRMLIYVCPSIRFPFLIEIKQLFVTFLRSRYKNVIKRPTVKTNLAPFYNLQIIGSIRFRK